MRSFKWDNAPADFYRSVQEWIDDLGIDRDRRIKEVRFQEDSVLIEPFGLESPTHWKLRIGSSNNNYKHGFVATIPNGRVFGKNAYIATPERKIIMTNSNFGYLDKARETIMAIDQSAPLQRTSEAVAVLSEKTSSNYYHWMIEILPRLHVLQKSKIKVKRYVISGKSLAPFHFATLEALGISGDQIIIGHDSFSLQAELLVVPLLTRGRHARWSCDFLRHALMTKPKIKPVKGFERIFISRKQASKRKLVNEDDIVQLLAGYGFTSIVAEELSVADQIRIFASARVVIGAHGAGLTNIIFSNPGAIIIELFSPQFVDKCFPHLSSLVGHQHYYLVGIGKRPPEYSIYKSRHTDITIDLSQLKQVLALAGIRK